jgi:small subunit ribosomal protein S6
MPADSTIYDLMLLLSAEAPEERRVQILADVEAAITGGNGTIVRNDDWGVRPLAYQISDEPSAEYHLLQFSGPPSLLEALQHSLKITDGVLRFRIIKVRPGTPAPPDPRPAVAATPAPTPAPVAPAEEKEAVEAEATEPAEAPDVAA